MNRNLGHLRQQLDVTGDPFLCLRIADVVDQEGGDGVGWRWLGERRKTPLERDGLFYWWDADAPLADDALAAAGIGEEHRLPLRIMEIGQDCDEGYTPMFVASDSRLSLLDDAESWVRIALESGQME